MGMLDRENAGKGGKKDKDKDKDKTGPKDIEPQSGQNKLGENDDQTKDKWTGPKRSSSDNTVPRDIEPQTGQDKLSDSGGYDRLLKTFKYAQILNPAFTVLNMLVKGAGLLNSTLGYDPTNPANKAAYEAQLAKEQAAKNEMAGFEGKPKPIRTTPNTTGTITPASTPPVTAATPSFGIPFVPGMMGEATVKKRKLLGGDLMRRV